MKKKINDVSGFIKVKIEYPIVNNNKLIRTRKKFVKKIDFVFLNSK